MKKLLTPASFAAAKWTAKQRSFGTKFQTSTEKKKKSREIIIIFFFKALLLAFQRSIFAFFYSFLIEMLVTVPLLLFINISIMYHRKRERINGQTWYVSTQEKTEAAVCREDGKMTFPSFSFFPCYISYMLSSAKNS